MGNAGNSRFPLEIKRMVRDRMPVSGDLLFDDCVSGDLLSRPALDACRDEIRRNLNISHLLILRRDRLARPGDAMDGVRMEKDILNDEGIPSPESDSV